MKGPETQSKAGRNHNAWRAVEANSRSSTVPARPTYRYSSRTTTSGHTHAAELSAAASTALPIWTRLSMPLCLRVRPLAVENEATV
mmetsp:Transcript_36618/g.72005  ORF Transcript_36618/g.72005 Transcript_36618/m.72005 type:complete len:86 (-) Transcript_36618:651-908(-)